MEREAAEYAVGLPVPRSDAAIALSGRFDVGWQEVARLYAMREDGYEGDGEDWDDFFAAAAGLELVGGEGSGSNWLKIAPGRTTLRILPPKEGETSPFVVTHQHYRV